MEIIAEIGKNFVTTESEQPLDVLLHEAKRLIEDAKDSGAKIVKFQVHNVKDEIHPESKLISPHFNHERYSWIKRNTYPVDFWWKIKEYCRELGVEFLATPMSRGAAMMLNEDIGVDRWKIGSGDILDFVMLDYIRDTGKPVILSSGMSAIQELRQSYEFLKEKTKDISILHCVSIYPCPLDELNLRTIRFLKKKYPGCKIGFSDHSLGLEGSFGAVGLGAEIIEKHFTLDRNSWGPDHKVSLLPNEFEELVKGINDGYKYPATSEMLGVETKYVHTDELEFRKVFHKSLYASRDLHIGEMIEPDMLYAMRPRAMEAAAAEDYAQFIGKRIAQDIPKYGLIKKL